MERIARGAWVSRHEFQRRLAEWHRDSRDGIVGDPDVPGMTGWLWVRDGHLLARLDADTTRAGVGSYLELLRLHGDTMAWHVVDSARGQPTKIAFGPDRTVLPGFYLYLDRHGL